MTLAAMTTVIVTVMAEVVSYTETSFQIGENLSGTLTFPQFDPLLGDLRNVTVQIIPSTVVGASIVAMHDGDGTDFVTADLRAVLQLGVDSNQVQASINGATSFQIAPASTYSGDLAAYAGAASGLFEPSPGWVGNGTTTLFWQVFGVSTQINGGNSSGSITVQSTTITANIDYTYTPILQFDVVEGAFHFVERSGAYIIERRATLTDDAPWETYLTTTTNSPGSVIALPITEATGFYRTRPALQTLSTPSSKNGD